MGEICLKQCVCLWYDSLPDDGGDVAGGGGGDAQVHRRRGDDAPEQY